jgi:hypothetical protein
VDARAEFEISERSPKGGVKLVVQQAVGKKGKKEVTYVRQVLNCLNSAPLEFPWPTKIIPQGNQNGPCVQPQAFATVAMYGWSKSYASEIDFCQRGGG